MRLLTEADLDPNDRRIVETAARLLREKFPVSRVILYGSRARKQATEDSDLDLLVLTKVPADWGVQRAMLDALYPMQDEVGHIISLMVIGEEEWEHGLYQVLPLKHEVDRDGVAA
ncbi:MAG: nucleotidyltransferase domain-containing protein [Phycisphaeraceae bacterium]|nr:nucleotidyltransferase domain-containing protein [Phycisphaeraceae bacterium]